MMARLLFGLLAQLAGEIGEPVQGGVDAEIGELGLDDLQVEVPDVGQGPSTRMLASSRNKDMPGPPMTSGFT
jgi:hypothetical protein